MPGHDDAGVWVEYPNPHLPSLGDLARRQFDQELLMGIAQAPRPSFAQAKIEHLQQELANAQLALIEEQGRIERQIRSLERFGEDDPYDNGAMLHFVKQFSEGAREYHYCAIKNGDEWYTSGPRRPGPWSWRQLTEFWTNPIPCDVYRVESLVLDFPVD